MKIWMVEIRDGENVYYEWTKVKPSADYVDGFLRAVKNITAFEIDETELKVLEKFMVI